MATSSYTNGQTYPKFDVLIIGGGITGLTAAIACRRKGFNVTVLEATQSYTHVSAPFPDQDRLGFHHEDWSACRPKVEGATL